MLAVLAFITAFYAWQTYDLAKQTARLAELTERQAKVAERQTELILGTNRPHIEIALVDVNYESLFQPEFMFPTKARAPVSVTISVMNDGNQSALGGEVYILGESIQGEERPLAISVWAYLSVPPSRSYWYWSDKEEFRELAPSEKAQYILRRQKLDFLTGAIFPYPEIEEEEMKHASEVPFAFAVVAIYEDDFERTWLSALELKIDCVATDCEVKAGRLRVFEVPPED